MWQVERRYAVIASLVIELHERIIQTVCFVPRSRNEEIYIRENTLDLCYLIKHFQIAILIHTLNIVFLLF